MGTRKNTIWPTRFARSLVVLVPGFVTNRFDPSAVSAAVFAITAQDAQSSAFASQADDSSVVDYNPGGLSHLKHTLFLLGTTTVRPEAGYGASPQSGSAMERAEAAPCAYSGVFRAAGRRPFTAILGLERNMNVFLYRRKWPDLLHLAPRESSHNWILKFKEFGWDVGNKESASEEMRR